MKTTLTEENIRLFKIDADYKENFHQRHDLSDFHAAALKWIGDVLRPKESQHFWRNDAYCWYTDGKQNHEQCVWMSVTGIAMFEDITIGKLYRIGFN